MQESVEETIKGESSYFEETTEATGTNPNTELPFLYNDVQDLVICDNKNKVNSRNGIDTHKVFDEMPDQIRAESETEFSDLYLCRTILSETPELVNDDVIMDDSCNLTFWHFKGEIGKLNPAMLINVYHGEVRDFQFFGDIVCCVCDFWGQKSLKEGVIGVEMVIECFGWKPGWLYSITHVDPTKTVNDDLVRDSYGRVAANNTSGDTILGWNDYMKTYVIQMGFNRGKLDGMKELESVKSERVSLIETILVPTLEVDGLRNVWNTKIAELTDLAIEEAIGSHLLTRGAVVLVTNKLLQGVIRKGLGSWCIWKFQADGSLMSTRNTKNEQLGRGIKITLFLKEDQREYLEEGRIKDMVKKYSEFISYPIYIRTGRPYEKKISDGEAGEPKTKEKDKKKKIKEVSHEWELINKQKPIWLHKPEAITKDEYASFHKSLTNDWEDLRAVKHLFVKGQLEFKTILYVPKRVPFDLFDIHTKRNNNKVYVRRGSISVMNFDDLPLNISCETLQQNKFHNLVRKCIEMFKDAKVTKHASVNLTQIVEGFAAFSDKLDVLCKHELVTQAASLMSIGSAGGGQAFLRPSTYTGIRRLLYTCANGFPLGSKTLFFPRIGGILSSDILLGSGLIATISVSPSFSRLPELIFEIMNSLIGKQGKSSSGALVIPNQEKLLTNQPELLHKFAVLIQMYGMLYLQIAEILMEKLPATFFKLFVTEVVVPFKKADSSREMDMKAVEYVATLVIKLPRIMEALADKTTFLEETCEDKEAKIKRFKQQLQQQMGVLWWFSSSKNHTSIWVTFN